MFIFESGVFFIAITRIGRAETGLSGEGGLLGAVIWDL
jgi:hypothetical protein